MRLIRRTRLNSENIDRRLVASPTEAIWLLRSGFRSSSIFDFDRTCMGIYAQNDEDILDALRRGDLVLIKDPEINLDLPLRNRLEAPAPLILSSKEPWPPPKQPQGIIFAKSTVSVQWGETTTGTAPEPASNFGNVMVAKAKAVPPGAGTLATTLGASAAIGRIAGEGVLQKGFGWMLRTAAVTAGSLLGSAGAVFIGAMLPSRMSDGTLYSDDELRAMDAAASRVRFQFRRDANGALQLYGIHATAGSAVEMVPITKARWKDQPHRTLEADVGDGITLIWTPNRGPITTPELSYPEHSDERMGSIFVHPIAEGTDSYIDGYPEIDDITWGDRIITFPAESGLRSMYVVFSKPFGGAHSYHPAPEKLAAFPDAIRARSKGSVQGGGSKRERWKDLKGRIYEWDRQHGAVEMYDKQGKHLGEFDAVTGEQTKPANPGRRVEK